MSQQQREKISDEAPTNAALTGNPQAASQAQKTQETLKETNAPTESPEDYLRRVKIVGGDGTPLDMYSSAHQAVEESRRGIEHFRELIQAGFIDPEQMRWTSKAQAAHRKGWICFCLVPTCHIGPFIPIRR